MTVLRAWPANMGSWSIGSQSMCGYAWQPLNLEDLWLPAPNRFSNRVVPGVAGSTGYRPRKAERTVPVQLIISGDANQAGTPNGDAVDGFVDNVDTLTTNVIDPPTAPNTTRTSTLTMPDASTRTAGIQVVGFEISRVGTALARAVLTITIPAGEHT